MHVYQRGIPGRDPNRHSQELEQLEEGGPTQYTVAQGVCFLKPDEEIAKRRLGASRQCHHATEIWGQSEIRMGFFVGVRHGILWHGVGFYGMVQLD